MLEWVTSPHSWAALVTLTILEVVLGIDNVVMISLLSDRLPEERRLFARRAGLALALITRLALLFSLAWIISMTEPLFTVIGEEFSGRDLMLLAGGLFLIAKATQEIHVDLEAHETRDPGGTGATMGAVLLQVALLDVAFSLDSVITAVGMAEEVEVMAIAITIAVVVMVVLIEPISRFIRRHPTVKMLALSFLILVGVALTAEALDRPMPKEYIYFAFGFAIFVEVLNLRVMEKREAAAVESGGSTPEAG